MNLTTSCSRTEPLITETSVERFFETLIAGDRPAAREVIGSLRRRGASSEELVTDLFWPTHELVERLYRGDQLTALSHHLATRLLRVLIDQSAMGLTVQPRNGRNVLALCGCAEGEELGAQMAVDLLEASGFTVRFGGGGISADEVLGQVHESRPDVLLMFCSAAADLPGIRRIIDSLREIKAVPHLQVAVGGGVFNRAEGLAEEIGADLWATSPLELVDVLVNHREVRASQDQRTVGRNRRKRAA